MFYSSGFHPKPDMTFSPALSLGVMSLGEMVDMKLVCDGDPRTWLDALDAGAPEGLRFIDAHKLEEGAPGVSKVIDTAIYAVAFSRSSIDDARARERVAAALAAPTLPIVRSIEGLGKKVDVRTFLRGLSWEDARARDAIARAGLVGDLVTLLAEVAVTPQGSAKISEVVEVLFGANTPCQSVRVSLGRASVAATPEWTASA